MKIFFTGKVKSASKVTDIKCGSKTICQAQGLTEDFGLKLGCVDIKGNIITSGSCSAGDMADTDYLRCGEDCYISCQDGLDNLTTETYFKVESTEECKQLCKLTKGCSAFKLETNGKKCILKYGTGADLSDTCKGNIVSFGFPCIFFSHTHLIIFQCPVKRRMKRRRSVLAPGHVGEGLDRRL